jgi:5,6,7,8-tetrahydromethanopterin hydro-lyase
VSAAVPQTQIGEAFVGAGAEAAHINTVLGSFGGPVEQAWVTALASPTAGHTPFLTVVQPGLPVKPLTLFVNKATIAHERHANLTWGAAQAGVAKGVADAVADGTISRSDVDGLLIVAAVWVNPDAQHGDDVFANNALATAEALRAGAAGRPAIDDVLAARGDARNAYYP